MTRRDWDDVRNLVLTVVLFLGVIACWAVSLPWLARLAVLGAR